MSTIYRYVEPAVAMKETARARSEPPKTKMCRFRASSSLVRFLQAL